jgi:ABC-type sugar transport system ATPase subunit
MALGIGFLPEDRKTLGLVLSMGGRANLSLPILDRLSRLGFVRTGPEKAMTRKYFDRLRVRTPHMDAPVWSLSGGNQQKIALAKWLASECGILLIDVVTFFLAMILAVAIFAQLLVLGYQVKRIGTFD